MMSLERLVAKAQRHRAKLNEPGLPPHIAKLTGAALRRTENQIRDLIDVPITPELEAEMRKMMDDPVSAAGPGLQLVVRRQFVAGNICYPVGSVVTDVRVLGPGYSALMAGHYLEWKPSDRPPAQARPLPPASPPQKPNPKIEIVDDADVVASWRKTLALTAERLDGDFGRARDLLMAHRDASALFLRATKIWTDAEAKRRGVVSVSPEI